jgi:hypothetical protein
MSTIIPWQGVPSRAPIQHMIVRGTVLHLAPSGFPGADFPSHLSWAGFPRAPWKALLAPQNNTQSQGTKLSK